MWVKEELLKIVTTKAVAENYKKTSALLPDKFSIKNPEFPATAMGYN